MAKKIIVIDDLTGKVILGEVCTVHIDEYEIEVSPETREALYALAKGDVRAINTHIFGPRYDRSNQKREESENIRIWARTQPQYVGRINTRGRIPQDIVLAYWDREETE